MVLISGLTLALVVLIIAGAAATSPKDADNTTDQKADATSLAQAIKAGDITEASQNRRTKRARGNIIPSSDDDEENFWTAKGHRVHIGDPEEVPEGQQGQADPTIMRPYGPRWALTQKSSSDEDEGPYTWETHGPRCCNQVKGVVDLKRGYGKDRVRALVAKIIAGSGGTESEETGGGEEDVFWAARGKRRRGQGAEEVMTTRNLEGRARPRL